MCILNFSYRNISTKIFTFLFASLLSLNICAKGQEYVAIKKSLKDDRDYRGLILQNGIKALLISDKAFETSACALNVRVGTYHNPKERMGLAHFLEHMLFLGTKKYPNPNEYQEYIAANGGQLNAWTGNENTEYYFDIVPSAYAGALDRFAQFFIEPLFTKEYVDRERHAVDNEYKLKINDDNRRMYEALKQLADPRHPIVQFGVGNLTTLGDNPELKDIRTSLIDFYNDYYSADRMTLILVGPQSLNELEGLALENFNPIKIRNVKKFEQSVAPFAPKSKLKQIEVQSIGDKEEYSMMFFFPRDIAQDMSVTYEYLNYLISYTGEGGLIKKLKDTKLIHEEDIYVSGFDNDQDLIQISYVPTELGWKNLSVIQAATMSYLDFIKKHKANGALADDIKLAGQRSFDFPNKRSALSTMYGIATSMHYYKLDEILLAGKVGKHSSYSPSEIQEVLNEVNLDNLYESKLLKDIDTDRVEEFYDIKFNINPLSPSLLEFGTNCKKLSGSKFKKLCSGYKLPQSNEFIPYNFALIDDTKYLDYKTVIPTMVQDSNSLQTWYAQDKYFKKPKANIKLQLFMDKPGAISRVYRDIMMYEFEDRLYSMASDFALAGVAVRSSVNSAGIEIGIEAYSDKLQAIVETVFAAYNKLTLKSDKFNSHLQYFATEYNNFYQNLPFAQARGILSSLLYEQAISTPEKIEIIKNADLKEYNSFVKSVKNRSYGVLFGYGNITESELQKLSKTISKNVKLRGDKKVLKNNTAQLTKQTRYKFNAKHSDSAVVKYYQADKKSYRAIATNALLNELMKTDFYASLRTEQQLGYVVASVPQTINGIPGIAHIIESSNSSVQDLISAIDKFNDKFINKLSKTSSNDLDVTKSSLVKKLLEDPKNFTEQSSLTFGYIRDLSLDFNYYQNIANEIESISLDEVIDFYKQVILNNDKVLIVTTNDNSTISGITDVTDLNTIRNTLSYSNSVDKKL